MEKYDIKDIRKELLEFSNMKDVKRLVIPYQKKATELLKLSDDALYEWYVQNGKISYYAIVLNAIQQKRDTAKYKRIANKIANDEELSDDDIEFVEEYEDSHNITESIIF